VIGLLSGIRSCARGWVTAFLCFQCLCMERPVLAQGPSTVAQHEFYLDCSAAGNGDGSLSHPWNSLSAAEAHPFAADDRIALARGTVCHGSFAPQGSGTEGHVIRLTAYGRGTRPRIVAPASARQILLLFNQEYWQVDSLDLSGGSTYGVFVTGDKGWLHHIYLKDLYVHDVHGSAFKNKDNGLVIVGPSSVNVFFDDILIDGVDAAHTNQWAGILVGGGSFPYKDDAPLNTSVQIRNSTAHDVYGDGIVLFRDARSSIRASAAWETGMQPTQDVGTPNAIWTWTCSDCVVADNEAYVTDSPGVDGGAYDIDWDNTDNTVERNYAHDTEGYCIAVFAAGYVTRNSEVRGNLCVDNGLSPRLGELQGAIFVSTWNDGVIRGLKIEQNSILWSPRTPGAAAIVSNAQIDGAAPAVFSENHVESTSALLYRVNGSWAASHNDYRTGGDPVFTLGDRHDVSLADLQSAGNETGSSLERVAMPTLESALHIEAGIDPALDDDGLLMPEPCGQLLVLRSLAGQYHSQRLTITVHLPARSPSDAEINALEDLESVYPGALHFERDASITKDASSGGTIRLESVTGRLLAEWHGFQNAATLGGAVRARLGAPDYSHMQKLVAPGGQE